MKNIKRAIAALLAGAFLSVGAVGFTACGDLFGGAFNDGSSKIYEVYEAYAESAGNNALSYDEWYAELLKMAKGDKGDDGAPGVDGEDGKDGKDGLDGNKIYHGKGAPASLKGGEGDMYVDTVSWHVYFYEKGAWVDCGSIKGADGAPSGPTTPTDPDGGDGGETVTGGDIAIHVIDLGKKAGDSIYIKAGENDILIDAGSEDSSASLICSYLNEYVTDGKLEYVIATHGDQDHIASFACNTPSNGIFYNFEVGTIIKFAKTNKTTQVSQRFLSALDYAESQGATVYTADQCYNEEGGAKRQYWLDEEHTLSMNILYNYYYFNKSSDENNHSVVTLFTKETSTKTYNFLLTGDLEKDGESRMVEYYSTPANSKSQYDVLPDVDFYKAGHHGSGTSSTDKLLSVIKPEYVAVSCCAGSPEYTVNNSNTFPYVEVFKNLLKYTQNIYCTSVSDTLPSLSNGKFSGQSYTRKAWNGNIVCSSDPSSQDGIKITCSGTQETILQSDWYKTYRQSYV